MKTIWSAKLNGFFIYRNRNGTRRIFLALAVFASIVGAHAQQMPEVIGSAKGNFPEVWDSARISVDRSSFLVSRPDATEIVAANGRKDGNLFAIDAAAQYSISLRLDVGFTDGEVSSVSFYSAGTDGFETRMSLYERILETLSTKYPPLGLVITKRQLDDLNQTSALREMVKKYRFATDEWTTADGIKISINNSGSRLSGSIVNERLFKKREQDRSSAQWDSRIQKARDARQAEDARYAQSLDKWNGKNINSMILEWGAPTRDYKMPNGNVVYVWEEKSQQNLCRTSIFTKNSKIYSWQAFGNNCRTNG